MDGDRRTACVGNSPAGAASGGDRLAIGLSALCLLHCLILPVVALLAPALGLLFVHSEEQVHWLMLAVALPVSAYALGRGYRRHRQPGCLALGGAGLLVMFLGVSHLLRTTWEVPLTVLGVLLLLAAHVLNLRRSMRVHECVHASAGARS